MDLETVPERNRRRISDEQIRAFYDSYALCLSLRKAAEEAGLDRKQEATLRRWLDPSSRFYDPGFAEAMGELRRSFSGAALDVISEIMLNPEARDSDRLGAAKFIAQRTDRYLGVGDEVRVSDGAKVSVTINDERKQQFFVALGKAARGELGDGAVEMIEASVVETEEQGDDGPPAPN